MVCVPSALEAILLIFPRACLNLMETHAQPASFWNFSGSPQIRAEWAGIRLAFVKQSLYSDLYTSEAGTSAAEVVKSSLFRTGPMGLLADLNAKFLMVREDSAPECHVWEESVGSNPQTREEDLRRAREQGKRAGGMDAREISWDSFDIVISLDIGIPQSIRRKYPGVFWAYLPADPGTPTAKAARWRPPEGFDITLTHTHRRFPVRPSLGRLAVEFPYSFQSSFSWDVVWPSGAPRKGVMVETQTFAALSPQERRKLETFGPVRIPRGTVNEVAAGLRSSKYYLRLQGGPLTGNGQVEAIMAGAISLGNPETYVQRSLFTAATIATTFASAMEKIADWEISPQRYQRDREEQLAIAEFICFQRPARQLLARYQQKAGGS